MEKLPAVVASIMLVGALTHCALLHSVCDLKAVQTNVHHSLLRELLYEFELIHYAAAEASRNICCAKGESTVDHGIVTWWFKKFLLDNKNLTIRQCLVGLKRGIPELCSLLSPVSSTRRASCELSISQSSVDLLSSQAPQKHSERQNRASGTTKILQNFWLTLVL